jgi:hypothetical protein
MQKGGTSNTVVVEDKEYVKTTQGEVVKVKNAPKHEDGILSLRGKNIKVPKNKGGLVVNNAESVISATHENRKPSSKLYTQKDEEIKVMPEVVKALSVELNLPVKLQKKAISPSKFLDLLIEKRNNVVKRYKDPVTDKVSNYRFNAVKANKAVLASIPSTEELYDVVFNLQQNMKTIEEEVETAQTGGIPERYKKKGFTKVGVKKQAPEDSSKKWQVLAKKGDKYKIVSGGYRGMEDYTQHKDKDRQKRFWDRMGGKNSVKAKDPFSPLFWHKKLGTWQLGGKTKLSSYPYMKGSRPALSTSNGKSIEVLDGRTISMDEIYDKDSVVVNGNSAKTFYKSKLKKYIK